MEKKVNSITNAQLAAWIGCVPSTIQFWRNGSTPIEKRLKKIAYRIGESYLTLKQEQEKGTLIEYLEKLYSEKGLPCASVSGRDFTDPGRYNEFYDKVKDKHFKWEY